jgi:pilus assembly protein FimV
MAYGLYDQAAELVQIAISRDPKRRDLKMKLLEVFFVWGNRERFLQTAHELANSRDQAPAGEWEKILIMGRQIAPEDALFSDSRGLAGAAKVVDLNLEGGQNRVDFDLLGEPSLGTAATQESVELDLGAALGEPSATEATGEAPQIESTEDIVLDPHEHADATGTTREMPEPANSSSSASDLTAIRPMPTGAGSTETMRIVSTGESEAPTVEQPQLRGGDQALRQKLDAHPGEQTAELAIDDLGLDLGALEGHGDEPPTVDPNSPTLLADLDEDTRRMLEDAEVQGVQAQPAAKAVEARAAEARAAEAQANEVTQKAAVPGRRQNATGTWMFTDTDFAAIAPVAKPSATAIIPQMAPPAEGGSTSAALSALKSDGELDLDLGSLESLKGQPSNGLDLDVGTASAASDAPYVDTQRLGADALVSDEMALPDLEPVTLSEVGTKLDLARAYMDMGDPEGARSILAEVMSEGSMSQKQEARRLMDALPG